MNKTGASHFLVRLAVRVIIGLTAVCMLAGCKPLKSLFPGRDSAKVTTVKAQIDALQMALERHKLDMDRYPTTEEGLQALVVPPRDRQDARNWNGPYLETVPKDPWGNEYVYKCPGEVNEESFDIISFGPDGEEGTKDDIRLYEEEEM